MHKKPPSFYLMQTNNTKLNKKSSFLYIKKNAYFIRVSFLKVHAFVMFNRRLKKQFINFCCIFYMIVLSVFYDMIIQFLECS